MNFPCVHLLLKYGLIFYEISCGKIGKELLDSKDRYIENCPVSFSQHGGHKVNQHRHNLHTYFLTVLKQKTQLLFLIYEMFSWFNYIKKWRKVNAYSATVPI